MSRARLADMTEELTEDMRVLSEINRRWGRVRVIEKDVPRCAMAEAGVRPAPMADIHAGFVSALAKFDDAMDAVRAAADPLLAYVDLADRAIRKAGS